MLGLGDSKWEGDIDLDAELRKMRPYAERAVVRAAVHLENEIKRTLTGGRSGRPYKVSKTGALHIASAPGEPPAVLFDNLRGSVGRGQVRWAGWVVGILVGPGLGQKPTDGSPDPAKSYARRLEYGGSDSRGIVILPRPYIEPTVQREQARIDQILDGAFDAMA